MKIVGQPHCAACGRVNGEFTVILDGTRPGNIRATCACGADLGEVTLTKGQAVEVFSEHVIGALIESGCEVVE